MYFNVMFVFNFQKNSHSLPVQNHDNSLLRNGEKEVVFLPVGIYYEALCPDSRNFILQHLLPSFDKAPNNFEIEFVPYGKAKVTLNDNLLTLT